MRTKVWSAARRMGTLAICLSALLAEPAIPASGALPQTSIPALQLVRTILTTPFVNSKVSMRDGEGAAYVMRDDSLWLTEDESRSAFEVNPYTGRLKGVIDRTAFDAAPKLGGGPAAGPIRDADLESMAYDGANDILYAFSGKCCTSSALPTAFRLERGPDGAFQVESYQPMPAGTDYTAAAWNPADGKLYVGVGSSLRQYDYETNVSGPTFQIPNLSGILGMSFSSDGSDLFVVTNSQRLFRVDWASRTIEPGWSLDLTPFGVLDSRAVELIDDRFYVLDGKKRPTGDPLEYAVFVFNVLAATTAPTASFRISLSSGGAPLTVEFTDTSTDAPTSWSWNFGDGATSALKSPTHVFRTPGTYAVTLTVSNAYGSSSAQTVITALKARTFRPTADSYVKSNHPKSNFGTARIVKGKHSTTRCRPYLKFSVKALPATPVSVELRLYVTDGSVSAGHWHTVSGTGWTETGITWDNAPPIDGVALAARGKVRSGTWLRIDVTDVVTENGTYSFAMKTQSADTVVFSSKEGSHPPQLVVALAEST